MQRKGGRTDEVRDDSARVFVVEIDLSSERFLFKINIYKLINIYIYHAANLKRIYPPSLNKTRS